MAHQASTPPLQAISPTGAKPAGAFVPANDLAWADWMRAQGERIEGVLDRLLPAPTGLAGGQSPDILFEAMRYTALGGGKRVRPLLVYAAGELVGADPEVLDGAAAAVECIHVYSLVHDDMPCMDDDDLRRGKPTVHKVWGDAIAMLVGDALQAQAFEALAAPLRRPDRAGLPAADLFAALARAAGAQGMAGGQALDLLAVGHRLDRAQIETMHRLKTGAMLAVSVELGLLSGGRPAPATARAVADFGATIGLAFQVVDDILDVTADSATLGKTAGKDEAQAKPTTVSMLGLSESRALAGELRRRAHESLAPLGAPARRLRELADFVVDRVS